jgi:alpha-ketoglutarate-dependent taurine dioxygenase
MMDDLVHQGPTTARLFAPAGGASLDWFSRSRDEVLGELGTHGAVVVRELRGGVDEFSDVVTALGGTQLEYTERSTPRSTVTGNVYTSTEYPADLDIEMHNENSYSDTWPAYLFFYCAQSAAIGGETPIADSRGVLDRLPDRVRGKFEDGLVYARVYREGLGLTWQEAFQTDDRDEVEEYCRAHGVETTWAGDDLSTSAFRPATRTAPSNGQEVWFNQANLFHPSTLVPEVRSALAELYDDAEFPRTVYLADGSPIEDSDIRTISETFRTSSLALPWEVGSVMIIDNMRMAHGRKAFGGDRKILVAMT